MVVLAQCAQRNQHGCRSSEGRKECMRAVEVNALPSQEKVT
jgi:hypothetical protein